MRARRTLLALTLASALAAVGSGEVRAAPIVYSIEFVASGWLVGGAPFRNERVVLAAISDTEPTSIGGVPTLVEDELGRLAQALASIGYLRGLLFTIGAILKFRQHKDNPHQMEIQLGGASGTADGAVVAILTAGALRDYALGEATGRILTSVSVNEPLELMVIRDHRVRTLRIDSIRGNRAELRASIVAPPP